MITNNHHKTLQLLILLLTLSLFITCEKYDRNNPWDENANLNPDDWALENLNVEYVSISERTLTWDYSGDERFDGFKIDRKAGGEEWDIGYGVAEKDVNSWNDNDILPDTTLTYQYRIYAYAGNNNFTSSSVSFVPDFPAPSNLKVEKQPDSDIAYKLSWTSNSTGEQGFKIDRKTTGGDWIIAFDSVPGNHTEYVDTNVFLGKSTIDVHYRVYAYFREYETKKISTETQAALPAPSNLEITVNSITSVSLSWQDNSTGEEGFRIDRKINSEVWQEGFASVAANETSYTDNDVDLDVNHYQYRVSAYFGEYNSDYDEAEYLPLEVSTNEVTNITQTSATSGGNAVGSHVNSRGIAYGATPNPSISGNTVQAGSGVGSFSAKMTGLTPLTTYHVRAYATNNAGTVYGENIMFTTIDLPTVTTGNITNITGSSATGSGNVTSDGGAPVTSRGLAYGTSPNPDISGSTVSSGSGTGSFTANITGLTPNTTYHVRAYATNSAGTDYGDNVTFTTPFLCGTNITFIYKGQQVTYGTVLRGGLCWMDRNLGASRVPTSSTDSQGYGDLFQWGRLDDGHQNRTSGTTSTLSNTDVPGQGNFITVSSSPLDWRSPQNENLWQGENGINNPCPPGWRVPTEAELNAERQSWTQNNSAGAYASTLKWPVGGYRSSHGWLYDVGSYGSVWSSSVSGTNARVLLLYSGNAFMYSFYRAGGMSVRCVKDL